MVTAAKGRTQREFHLKGARGVPLTTLNIKQVPEKARLAVFTAKYANVESKLTIDVTHVILDIYHSTLTVTLPKILSDKAEIVIKKDFQNMWTLRSWLKKLPQALKTMFWNEVLIPDWLIGTGIELEQAMKTLAERTRKLQSKLEKDEKIIEKLTKQ